VFKRRVVLLLALVAAGSLLWWVTHRKSDRQLIDDVIAKVVHGVETKSLDEIMECVAPDYQDDTGLSRVDVWRGAAQWVRTVDAAAVTIDNYFVDIQPPTATGTFEVRMQVTRNGQILELGPMHLTVQFEKERRRFKRVWLVKSVSGYSPSRLLEDYM
jgi:hypothetical protein